MPAEATALAAAPDAPLPRPFRIVATWRETRDTMTFELEPLDDRLEDEAHTTVAARVRRGRRAKSGAW